MQLVFRLCSFLILYSVLYMHEGFPKFFLEGLVSMGFPAFLKRLTLNYELGFGLRFFGLFKHLSNLLCAFLFVGFGIRLLGSDGFARVLIRFVCDWREESNNGFCSENLSDEDKIWMLTGNPKPESEEEFDDDENSEDDEIDDITYEDLESHLSKLRKLIRIERRKANAALAELAKERAASASAAEEAMAMILRLQNEKSFIELESSQYKRLAEEKQIHDREVIRSLQWLVWRHESERSLQEEQPEFIGPKSKLCSRIKSEEDEEARQSSFRGNILDALENVLYSSRDTNSPPP